MLAAAGNTLIVARGPGARAAFLKRLAEILVRNGKIHAELFWRRSTRSRSACT